MYSVTKMLSTGKFCIETDLKLAKLQCVFKITLIFIISAYIKFKIYLKKSFYVTSRENGIIIRNRRYKRDKI